MIVPFLIDNITFFDAMCVSFSFIWKDCMFMSCNIAIVMLFSGDSIQHFCQSKMILYEICAPVGALSDHVSRSNISTQSMIEN